MKKCLSGAAVAAALFACGQVSAATYSLEVIPNAPRYGGTASLSDISINNSGTLAFHRVISAGNVSLNEGGIQTIETSGSTDFLQTGSSFDSLFEGRFPRINDDGAILAYFSGPVVNGFQTVRYAVVEPDGSTRNVAYVAPNSGGAPVGTSTTFKAMDRIAFNTSGEVAALVRTLDDKTQIVKLPNDGGAPIVIAEASGDLFTFSGPDINDEGDVVFSATELGNVDPRFSTTVGIYKGDGSSLERVFAGTPDAFPFGVPNINNEGDIFSAGSKPGTGGARTILLKSDGSSPVVTEINSVPGSNISAAYINDYGQQAYVLDNELYIDGDLIAGDGTVTSAGVISRSIGTLSPVAMLPGEGFNNLGQAVIGTLTQTGEVSGIPQFDNLRYLVNPEGGTSDNPLLPVSSTPEGENDIALNIFNGLGVDAPIWVDPIVATGFVYTQGAGGENFATLSLPNSLPLTQTMFDLSFDYTGGSFSGQISTGEMFDFLAFDALGISTFTISGIDVEEAVEPTDPFVVGLTFVAGGFQSTLSIDAITFDTDNPGGDGGNGGDGGSGGDGGNGGGGDPSVIPVPAAVWLILSGIGALGLIRRSQSS